MGDNKLLTFKKLNINFFAISNTVVPLVGYAYFFTQLEIGTGTRKPEPRQV